MLAGYCYVSKSKPESSNRAGTFIRVATYYTNPTLIALAKNINKHNSFPRSVLRLLSVFLSGATRIPVLHLIREMIPSYLYPNRPSSALLCLLVLWREMKVLPLLLMVNSHLYYFCTNLPNGRINDNLLRPRILLLHMADERYERFLSTIYAYTVLWLSHNLLSSSTL